MDLVIQSPDLSTDAVAAFKVACLARRVERKTNSARLVDIRDDLDTRKAAQSLGNFWKCDFAFVPAGLRLAQFRVLVIDMDSTLIDIECVDEIAVFAGKGKEVAAITEAAMCGEIDDYRESLRQRVALLAGLDEPTLQRVYDDRLRLNVGAESLLATCRAARLKTLLVSGGFTYFTDRLQRRLGIDRARANVLEASDGKLTGRVSGPPEHGGEIIDAEGKARALRELCGELGCATDKAIALGDGANDLKMMKLAGISVAYRAKPVVQRQASQALNFAPLDGVISWFVN